MGNFASDNNVNDKDTYINGCDSSFNSQQNNDHANTIASNLFKQQKYNSLSEERLSLAKNNLRAFINEE